MKTLCKVRIIVLAHRNRDGKGRVVRSLWCGWREVVRMFRLIQVFSGHGCFGRFVLRIRILETTGGVTLTSRTWPWSRPWCKEGVEKWEAVTFCEAVILVQENMERKWEILESSFSRFRHRRNRDAMGVGDRKMISGCRWSGFLHGEQQVIHHRVRIKPDSIPACVPCAPRKAVSTIIDGAR